MGGEKEGAKGRGEKGNDVEGIDWLAWESLATMILRRTTEAEARVEARGEGAVGVVWRGR